MAKNPLGQMMAQAVTPGAVKSVPPGKIGTSSTKSVPVPKGVQKTTSLGPAPGKPPPQPVAPRKGFGGKPAPKPFGK
jgi:hypothetical protein